jgi:hypothetical protein
MHAHATWEVMPSEWNLPSNDKLIDTGENYLFTIIKECIHLEISAKETKLFIRKLGAHSTSNVIL